MKFNFKLRRLCGAYYGSPTSTESKSGSGANLVYTSDGNTLLSAVSNRVQMLDLQTHTVRTLPIEARSNIRCMALSPDDCLLVTVDVQNYAMLVNVRRGVVLHRFRFSKGKVRQVLFSPCGQYMAVTVGKHVQVWNSLKNRKREFAPLVLHRTYTGLTDDVVALHWSTDSSIICAASRDGTARIWTLHTTKHYEPVTLSGHKSALVGIFLSTNVAQGANEGDTFHGLPLLPQNTTVTTSDNENSNRIRSCFTVSIDGALVTWECNPGSVHEEEMSPSPSSTAPDDDHFGDDAVSFFTGGDTLSSGNRKRSFHELSSSSSPFSSSKSQAHKLVHATWSVKARHYFHQEGATVTSTDYCEKERLLVVGFSSGLFGLYEMPSVSNIHTLSVGSDQIIRTSVLNKTGEWLAIGCPTSQQLLVWEWRSETYILKQRGHAYGMRCMAYSPDGIVVCSGGEDGKLKLWNATSGFCYVTLEQSHTAPVTAVAFANSSVVLSASLDGTVKAHDLHRYRTFKTLTTPTPTQFLSLAVDPSGEVVTAGTIDPFHIYVWNLQTGKLMDILTGHTGPVCGLAFQSTGGTLASASWDGTVKFWDLYKGNVPTESVQHTSDVVCVAFRPDGKEICTGTIGGLLSFWDVEDARLKFEIDGRRDIAGGRKMNDRMTADNNASSRYFTSVCYSADGSCVLAGGNSKYVCIYEISQQILLKKFQVTFNRSLDGVLDELNSKNLGEGGPIDDHADSGDETTYNALTLPGAKRGDDGSRKSRVEVLTTQVAFSSTGREWATVSGEGLHVYSLDDDMIFDPIALTEDITPATIDAKLSAGEYGIALKMAIHLNESELVQEVLEGTPYGSIPHVVRTIGPEQLERLLQFVSKSMADSPHVEFYLQWCLTLLQTHGTYMEKHRGTFMRAFRAMHKNVQSRHDELKTICDENKYTLAFVKDQAQLLLSKHS
mmetsp:Transcript_5199/g.7329  ORF Transcript_5199/g.7329 Transcript_5199/m.7329 type:complete len:946 (+) Transcript_5199:168-3005(+)